MGKVVTSFNLNLLLKLFFYSPILTNHNLLLKIYCETLKNFVVIFNYNFLFFFLSFLTCGELIFYSKFKSFQYFQCQAASVSVLQTCGELRKLSIFPMLAASVSVVIINTRKEKVRNQTTYITKISKKRRGRRTEKKKETDISFFSFMAPPLLRRRRLLPFLLFSVCVCVCVFFFFFFFLRFRFNGK